MHSQRTLVTRQSKTRKTYTVQRDFAELSGSKPCRSWKPPERNEFKESVFLAAIKFHNVQIGQRVSHLRGTLRLSPPTSHLSSFAGSLDLDEGEESERIILSLSDLL
ncbi:hypothetical protein BLNAU_20429 [Blattamonas nauphoetae]|uniref:Uncharacterized protein n=1 Tax=Blattamonas nauphoetae TaxID=2049346 RepID=A0ABQ9WYM5_9EUKA|nr:hypothetical protein BLNAU_20429 [Blattamonas nauphoetae]